MNNELCFGCNAKISGKKFRCLECDFIVMCAHCTRSGVHGNHGFAAMDTTQQPMPGISSRISSSSTSLFAVAVPSATSSLYHTLKVGAKDQRLPPPMTSSTGASCFLPYGIVPKAPEPSELNLPQTEDAEEEQQKVTTANNVDDDNCQFPAKWDPPQTGMPFKRKQLSSSDPQYKEIVKNMKKNGGEKWTKRIHSICRIENHRLYKIYMACKEEMDRENGAGFQNERLLWHGTSADSLNNIYRGGFNRGYCGKNATAYGDGVYFATSFEYSASKTYSPPDWNGHKYIFQCRVLTGQYTQGQQGLKEPPHRDVEMRYDSVVDNDKNPSMFVIFKDMQVYPDYVITLKL